MGFALGTEHAFSSFFSLSRLADVHCCSGDVRDERPSKIARRI